MASSDTWTVKSLSQCLEVVPLTSFILENENRKGKAPHDGDPESQLRDIMQGEKQFRIFYSILLGDDQRYAASEFGRDRGGVSCVTDHKTLQLHSPGLVPPMATSEATFWLPAYLKKREQASGYSPHDCFKLLEPLYMAFMEVKKFGSNATAVAKVFARMEIDHVEVLLQYPEDLRATLQEVAVDVQEEDIGRPARRACQTLS